MKAINKAMLPLIFLATISCTTTQTKDMQTVEIQAHRGGRGLMPENTVPAFIHAVKMGIPVMELDLVISADSQVVVSHEAVMSHTYMLKPDGTEISKAEERTYKLYQMPYDSIMQFESGMKPHSGFPEQKKIKIYKPLLSAVIDSVETYCAANDIPAVKYNMEIKSSEKGDNVYHPEPERFVALVMDIINKKGIKDRINIQSFDTRPLEVLHKTDSSVLISFLVSNKLSIAKNLERLSFKPDIYSPNFNLIDSNAVDSLHKMGIQVVPWTPNNKADIKIIAEMGVDAIITDYPDRAIEVLREMENAGEK